MNNLNTGLTQRSLIKREVHILSLPILDQSIICVTCLLGPEYPQEMDSRMDLDLVRPERRVDIMMPLESACALCFICMCTLYSR